MIIYEQKMSFAINSGNTGGTIRVPLGRRSNAICIGFATYHSIQTPSSLSFYAEATQMSVLSTTFLSEAYRARIGIAYMFDVTPTEGTYLISCPAHTYGDGAATVWSISGGDYNGAGTIFSNFNGVNHIIEGAYTPNKKGGFVLGSMVFGYPSGTITSLYNTSFNYGQPFTGARIFGKTNNQNYPANVQFGGYGSNLEGAAAVYLSVDNTAYRQRPPLPGPL